MTTSDETKNKNEFITDEEFNDIKADWQSFHSLYDWAEREVNKNITDNYEENQTKELAEIIKKEISWIPLCKIDDFENKGKCIELVKRIIDNGTFFQIPYKRYYRFCYNIGIIKIHCDHFNSIEKQIEYLEWLYTDVRQNFVKDSYFTQQKYIQPIYLELEYRKKQLLGQNLKQPSYEEMKSETKEKSPEPIRWLGKHSQLVYLFEELRGKGFLAQGDDTTTIIDRHFSNDKGEPLKNTAQVWRNVKSNAKGVRKKDVLDEIIEKTRKTK